MLCMIRFLIVATVALACVTSVAATGPASKPSNTASGDLLLPADYHEWNFVSAGLGMSYGPSRANDANKKPALYHRFCEPAFLRVPLEERGSGQNLRSVLSHAAEGECLEGDAVAHP